PSLSSRSNPPRPSSLPDVARPPRLELISETDAKRTCTRRPTFLYPPPPLPWSESAGICHGSRRFVQMPPELPVRISPSFLHQISSSEAPRSSRPAGETVKGSNWVEIFEIVYR
ncbi:hypothetical protein Prudu_022061, partial [Prunus dulcis]